MTGSGPKLTIRTRILGGYAVVIILFISIVLNIFLAQKGIARKLNIINDLWLPKTSVVMSLSNYYHLDESFDLAKMIQNLSNKIIFDSFSKYHPKLFENQLDGISKSLEEASLKMIGPYEQRYIRLINGSIEDVRKKHSEYRQIIDEITRKLESGKNTGLSGLNEMLLKKKNELKSEISFLRRRFDNAIRASLSEILKTEKKASIITSALSLLAIIIAGLITLFALYTLSPIKRLIAGVKRISQGDYDYRFEIKSEGEIKTLADEFNNMSQSILERNRALKEQQKKLIQSERMAIVGRMASHITHEIKNPLNSMSLNTELLEDELKLMKSEKGTEEAFGLTISIRKEIDRLSNILEEYLSYARLPKIQKTRFAVEALFSDLLSLTKSELSKNDIAVRTSFENDRAELIADYNQIKQALLNILKNSMEAIEAHGEIRISTSRAGKNLKITIEDTGKGIEPEIIERIFDPFFSTKSKGTGLGLPITQKIITEQSGEISVKSEHGKWTRFEILLPLVAGNDLKEAVI